MSNYVYHLRNLAIRKKANRIIIPPATAAAIMTGSTFMAFSILIFGLEFPLFTLTVGFYDTKKQLVLVSLIKKGGLFRPIHT